MTEGTADTNDVDVAVGRGGVRTLLSAQRADKRPAASAAAASAAAAVLEVHKVKGAGKVTDREGARPLCAGTGARNERVHRDDLAPGGVVLVREERGRRDKGGLGGGGTGGRGFGEGVHFDELRVGGVSQEVRDRVRRRIEGYEGYGIDCAVARTRIGDQQRLVPRAAG